MKPNRRRFFLIVLAVIFVSATAILTVFFWPLIKNLNDAGYRETFSAWVKDLGIKGIAALFGLQVLQIVVAVIPGGPMELIAGAAYGAWGGLLLCAAGAIFASSLIYLAVEKFGLPLVYRFFGKEKVESWKFLDYSKRNARMIFILFLIPGTPKDLLTWLAPISRLPFRQFLILSNLGRIPAILCTTIMGDSVIRGNWVLFAVIFILTAVIGLLGIQLKDRIIAAVRD